jgi:hypothetical protein
LPKEEHKQEFPIVNGSSGCTITVTDEIGKPIPYCGGLEEISSKDIESELVEIVNDNFFDLIDSNEETIEEFAERLQEEIQYGASKSDIIDTLTKWQQEQDNKLYSEKEVRDLFNLYKEEFSIYRNSQILNVQFEEWLNENKKQQ